MIRKKCGELYRPEYCIEKFNCLTFDNALLNMTDDRMTREVLRCHCAKLGVRLGVLLW